LHSRHAKKSSTSPDRRSTYLRYHGDHYSGSYSDQQLSREAEWINRQLAAGLDVFAYFNNDA
jgi:uncharacterized protein YecE (DUF72 family)